jgi:hypothetical protein
VVVAVGSTRSFSTSTRASVRKVRIFATIRCVSTIGFRAFKRFVLMENWMESTSKYHHVFLHEAHDDFDDDKTLAAAEGEASGRHQKSLERWKSGGRGEGGGKKHQ